MPCVCRRGGACACPLARGGFCFAAARRGREAFRPADTGRPPLNPVADAASSLQVALLALRPDGHLRKAAIPRPPPVNRCIIWESSKSRPVFLSSRSTMVLPVLRNQLLDPEKPPMYSDIRYLSWLFGPFHLHVRSFGPLFLFHPHFKGFVRRS